VREDGAEAVKWARRASRCAGISRHWPPGLVAISRGEFAEALETMQQALSSGAADAYLFFQAATIYQSVGGNGKR